MTLSLPQKAARWGALAAMLVAGFAVAPPAQAAEGGDEQCLRGYNRCAAQADADGDSRQLCWDTYQHCQNG